jgi:hypothetical protein
MLIAEYTAPVVLSAFGGNFWGFGEKIESMSFNCDR